MIEITPDTAEIVAIAFEGPDPYAQAGGLGVRMTGLTQALARRGFPVHFFFVGDPTKPGRETQGNLTLYRWSQGISQQHPDGVYAAQYAKKQDMECSLPKFIVEQIASPAFAQGRRLIVRTEEWQTAGIAITLSDLLHQAQLRDHAVILWNANHWVGLDQIDFQRLGYVASLTTVSRFMAHQLQNYGISPAVLPNGIADAWFEDVSRSDVRRLRSHFGRPLLVKFGRFDPDQRWLMAVDSVAFLKRRGLHPTLIMRGGPEPYGDEVVTRAQDLGLSLEEITLSGTPDRHTVLNTLASADSAKDIIHLRMFFPNDLLPVLYRAADAVLVNSGFEASGLVGLEVMAAGGLAITGPTGGDYVRNYVNSLALSNDDPRLLADLVELALDKPTKRAQMIRQAQKTARTYAWSQALDELLAHIQVVAGLQTSQVSMP